MYKQVIFFQESSDDFNPWDVNHVSSFLYYCCPECDFKISTEEKFIEHAIANHDKSKTLLDNSAKDELDYDFYDSDVEGPKVCIQYLLFFLIVLTPIPRKFVTYVN